MPEGSPASHAGLTDPTLQDGGIQSVRFGPERIRQSIVDRDGIAAANSRFLEKKPTAEPSFVPGTNTGTFVFGGCVDTRTVLHVFRVPVGFRAELRDFYSGSPGYNQQLRGSLQNNVVFTGGLLIKF